MGDGASICDGRFWRRPGGGDSLRDAPSRG